MIKLAGLTEGALLYTMIMIYSSLPEKGDPSQISSISTRAQEDCNLVSDLRRVHCVYT